MCIKWMRLIAAVALLAVSCASSGVEKSAEASPPAATEGELVKAPDFQLPGSDGKEYSLAQFKGKQPVVLAWFPKAFTGG